MPVVINFKICDNCDACSAINVCPTQAFLWNDEKKTLEVDDEKCINCGLCATSKESCQVGAIKFGKTKEEYEKILREVEADTRTIADLMVDRYGAQPINMPFYCKDDELEKIIATDKYCFVEVFEEDTIECLIKSIPIKEILKGLKTDDVWYSKLEVSSKDFLEKYNINQLPSMLIFKDEKNIGKVEGYYSQNEKNEFIGKLNEILDLSNNKKIR